MHRLALLSLVCPLLAFAAEGVDAGVAAAATPEFSLVEMDALWATRDEAGAQDKLLQLTGDAVKAQPNSFEFLWRAARIRLWAGDGELDNEKKKQLGKDTWELGDRAAREKPGAVEGYYFAAAGIGSYSQAVGILNALGQGLESKFNERLDKAINIDPRYAHAAPPAVKGRYYFELPWPKRNLRKSADWLKKALALDPGALRPLLWLAETQWRDGDVPAARATLAKLEAGSLPSDLPEERRCKARGKTLGQDMDKER
jgi:hypothetical protein